jgi:hypothetical protein
VTGVATTRKGDLHNRRAVRRQTVANTVLILLAPSFVAALVGYVMIAGG